MEQLFEAIQALANLLESAEVWTIPTGFLILKIDEDALNRVEATMKRSMTMRTPRVDATPSDPRARSQTTVTPLHQTTAIETYDYSNSEREGDGDLTESEVADESVERKRAIFRLLNTTLDTLYMPLSAPALTSGDHSPAPMTSNALSLYSQEVPPGANLVTWFNERLEKERNIQIQAIEEFLNNAQKSFAKRVRRFYYTTLIHS